MALHDWAGLELRHLIALQAVADERSFGRAADRLGYTQSAVSHQIAALESLVGQRLVEIERGELDLTFTVFPLQQGPFEAVELLRDPYLLVVSANSTLSRMHQPFKLDQLADVPLIGPRMCISGEQLEARMRGFGVEPRVIFRSDDNGTVQGLVGAGVGAALLPRLAIDPTDRTTRTLTLGPDVPPRVICVAWHRDRYRSPAARAFVETARSVCADLQ